MVGNKPFSAYLEEARAKSGQPTKTGLPKITSFASTGKRSTPQDPLSWFVDILSRPMRTVENVPNQILNEALKVKQAEATGEDYNVVGGAFNVLTSPLRGFFSTNPEDQPTGAELIEKTSDVTNYGKAGYVDVQNNVDPLAAGAGGLALDIALDPLTWVPGAQYVKAGQMVGRGVRGAAAATDALIAGSNFGEVIGAGSRVTARAAKAQADKINTARNAALDQAEELAVNAPPARLQGTAFEGLLKTDPRPAASAVVNNIYRSRFEPPKIPVTPLKEAPVLGPMTKAETKSFKSYVNSLKKQVSDVPVPATQAVDAAAMMDKVGPPVGSTEAEQWVKSGAVDNILAQLSKVAPKEIQAANAPAEVATEITQRIAGLKSQETRLKAQTPVSDVAEKSRVVKLAGIQKQIKLAEKELAQANPKRAAQVTTNISASGALKSLLADPIAAKEFTDALGRGTVEGLSKVTDNAQLIRATNYLGKIVRGEMPKTSSQLQNDLAQELRRQYDIKIPTTNTPAISGTSAVGTERVAEAQVAKAQGQTLRDVPWLGGYSQEQIDHVAEILPQYLKNDFLKVDIYPFTTGKGALSTSDIKGTGIHKYANEYNQMDQYSLAEALIKDYRKKIFEYNKLVKSDDPASKIAGSQRANMLMDDAFKELDLSFNWLDSRGVSVWMGINENRVRLYLHQMLDTLNDAARGAGSKVRYDTLEAAVFNKATSVPITNLMDAVVALHRNPKISDAEILTMLKKDISGADNFLNQTEPQTWKHYLGKPSGILSKPNFEKGTDRIKGYYGLIEPEKFGKDLVTLLRQSAPTMTKVVTHNEEMALARAIADEKNLSQTVVDDLWEMADDPARMGETIRAIANVPIYVGEKGASNWAMPKVAQIISGPSTNYWPNDVVHDAQTILKLVSAQAKNSKDALTKAIMANGEYAAKTAEEIVVLRGSIFEGVNREGKVINEALYNDAVNEQAFNDMIQAGRTSKFNELFRYNKGKEQVVHPFNQVKIKLSEGLADFKLNINKVSNNNPEMYTKGTTVVQQAFNDIARNVPSDPKVAQARADLEPVIWSVFGNPADPASVGIWQRAGASLEDIQVYMKKAKINFDIDLASASKKMAQGENAVQAGLDDWRLWIDEIDNPLKFLSDMYFAGSMLHVDKSAAALFVARAGVTSDKARAGYTKIPELNLFEHPLLGHMPKNTFIREDILQEVNNLERMIMSDYSPKSDFGKFFNEKYLPVLGAWKKGVTIYRLGHHVRNLLSSEGIQWTVEGTRYYGASATDATRILMAHKRYDGVDWSQQVESLVKNQGRLEMPTGGTKLFDFGKKPVTVDMMYEAADKHGLFTDFRLIEDLFEDGAGGAFEKAVNRISLKDTKFEKLAGGLSEYQAHFSRLHHFAQILRKEAKRGAKNWDELVEKAAIKVRRHHPDGMTLTPFEQQVMKPLIPFYSWFRQMIPVIAEGIAQHPGRFMVYPKASYNLAIAMGVNPESLQDPFPTDTLFPDFITEQLTGPVVQIDGNYFKASPGYAYADILNQFVADPKQGLMGMVTPFIKTPGELITGTRWDTGVSIQDYSDYIDSQLPGVNYLANFTGVSPSGSAVSLLSGQGIDSQYAVDKGNKTPLDQGISVSNWFTGMGLMNISKQNYQDLAEIQLRNREAEAAKQEAGTARSPF